MPLYTTSNSNLPSYELQQQSQPQRQLTITFYVISAFMLQGYSNPGDAAKLATLYIS